MEYLYRLRNIVWILLLLLSTNCKKEEAPPMGNDRLIQLVSVRVGTHDLAAGAVTSSVPRDQPIVAAFSTAVDVGVVEDRFVLTDASGAAVPLQFSFLDNNRTVSARPAMELPSNTAYQLQIQEGPLGAQGEVFGGVVYNFITLNEPLELTALSVDGQDLLSGGRITDVDFKYSLEAAFNYPVTAEDLQAALSLRSGGTLLTYQVEPLNASALRYRIEPLDSVPYWSRQRLRIEAGLTSTDGHEFGGYNRDFHIRLDTSDKFPRISDEALLDLVQAQTFRYFWDFGHPVSGMARERNASQDNVTSGGSGFGLMSIVVGMERGFITRREGIDRIQTIVDFLARADRFHGAWSHWLSGTTGEVNRFSARDDGGDLVETSYLVMGLLTVRQYLDSGQPDEAALIAKINELWEGVEWDWYTQGGQSVLYWHWSPNHGWAINLPIRGWNESLITYVLAAASPTHPIDAEVYHEGWARNGGMINGRSYYDIQLPLGPAFGGPLFFAHYTFLGLDPRNLKDRYADYWEQNVAHTRINRQHCILNPNNFVGYSEECWGLTASDGNQGYSAHSPTNDLGVLTPTAALSSIPYAPEAGMEALHHFYYQLGDRLWGPYGFYDAFNPTANWFADSYLAIDQGPIIIMIENYRSGLLWELFMSAPEVRQGLDKLGFSY